MNTTEFELKDGRVHVIHPDGRRTLRIFAPDLPAEIPYIAEMGATSLAIMLIDPVGLHNWSISHEEALLFSMRKPESADVDLSPLRNCPFIEELSLEGNLINSYVLEHLPRLHTLSIDNTDRKAPVRLDRLGALQTLWIQKPGRNISGISSLTNLRHMRLWNYQPKSRDLSELNALTNLTELELISPRIDSLNGAEFLTSLTRLGVYYARTLKDASALHKCPALRDVAFEHVPALKDAEHSNF